MIWLEAAEASLELIHPLTKNWNQKVIKKHIQEDILLLACIILSKHAVKMWNRDMVGIIQEIYSFLSHAFRKAITNLTQGTLR